MSKDNLGMYRGGAGIPWPILPRSVGSGEEGTIIGSPAPFGTVLMTGATVADPLLDGEHIGGAESPMLVYELPDATADPDVVFYGWFGVAQADETIPIDGKGPVEFGPATILVRVFDAAATSYVNGQGLVVDFTTTPGVLIKPTATGDNPKTVGRVAKAYSGLTAGENLLWVHFDGMRGWGNVNTLT